MASTAGELLDDPHGTQDLPVSSFDGGVGNVHSLASLPLFRPACLRDVSHGHHDFLGVVNARFSMLLEQYGRTCNSVDEFWCMQASYYFRDLVNALVRSFVRQVVMMIDFTVPPTDPGYHPELRNQTAQEEARHEQLEDQTARECSVSTLQAHTAGATGIHSSAYNCG